MPDNASTQPSLSVSVTGNVSFWRPHDRKQWPPEAPTGGKWNEVRFQPVTAKKIRALFTHQGNYKSGVTEMLVWP
jgi:hypothetical protein